LFVFTILGLLCQHSLVPNLDTRYYRDDTGSIFFLIYYLFIFVLHAKSISGQVTDLTLNKKLSDWMMIAVLSIHSEQTSPSVQELSIKLESQAHTQATVSLVKRFDNEDWPHHW
jgi:hypothetical protein